ncbi:glycosyltransferase family 1 protein [Pigmentiphaga aceris]|uniref:Glycosyltransferase family 1 protein n=1 Tax=Pigmentiphaga aceris TaxID=1940612 RepID=A0A5C0AXG2_9BURK|nr:glycosyltransferase family 1 protein [Pigmentiphaga aceris]QEI05331.1 glycosyltransferase family 1 protein [Pigmentiphaga aceris]
MHIVYVTETWPPEVNGVALTASRTVDFLRSRGNRVTLVRPRQQAEVGTPPETMLAHGIPIPRYNGLRFGLPMGGTLAQAWSQDPPDLVHVATEGPLGWSAVRTAVRLGIPVSSDFRTRFDSYTQFYAGRFLTGIVTGYLRRFHNRCGRTFVPTEALRSELHALGYRHLKVSGRGVDSQRFDPAHRRDALRAQWGAEGPVALYVGRLAAEKNLPLALDAYNAMRRANPATRLVVVGDGPLRETVRQRCPEAILAGVQRGDDLSAHYASADIFLFPSLTETFGNVTLEAMASGLAVVAFQNGAAAQHIHDGMNGFAPAPGDNTAFVAAAVRLAAKPALRERLAQAARIDACAVDWDRILTDFARSLEILAKMETIDGRALLA